MWFPSPLKVVRDAGKEHVLAVLSRLEPGVSPGLVLPVALYSLRQMRPPLHRGTVGLLQSSELVRVELIAPDALAVRAARRLAVTQRCARMWRSAPAVMLPVGLQ